ncbi:M23 family metallopeptidase [Nocardia brasiliensis]|uniref:Putative peptidase n=1 Tax=Nocardia brasiliensis (strain ATCC 700358 / HUJEG-1) TaxID=1133849 RepID=K0EN38_NOCB7|nr:M23 family metallopeptidase [Nocardia brasiliensis]AFT98776.1 putative peptidase [Nocardia brasiliensis ATCC 700358]OCF89042.1 peptidase M23 [Nocardia brasiliensis]
MSLIGDDISGRPTRHRAESTAADRVKVAAGVAVAAGALIGTVSQVAPAVASPLLPGAHDGDEADAPIVVKGTGILPIAQAKAAAPAPEAPAPEVPVASQVAAPIAAAPFGLQNLPPEVAGPLAQAEQILKGVQQQVAPAPQVAVRPVAGAISSGFGSRWGEFHYGLDFADNLGAPIHSVSNGTVIEAGPASGFGLWVRVLQDDGTTAVYGHVNEMLVQEGQRVNAGDVIATVGNRGQSTGPHLHLEIWDRGGSKIDPMPYLAAKGVPLQWGPSAH